MKKMFLMAIMAAAAVSVSFGGDVVPDGNSGVLPHDNSGVLPDDKRDDKRLDFCNNHCYSHASNCPKFDAESCFKRHQECMDKCLKE